MTFQVTNVSTLVFNYELCLKSEPKSPSSPTPGHDLHPAAGDSVTQLLTPRIMSSARSDRHRSPATPPLSNANFRQATPPLSNAHLCRVTPYADYPCTQRLSTMGTAAGSSAPTSQSTAQKLTIGANSWVMTSYTGTSKTVKKFLGKVLCVEDDDALVTFCRYHYLCPSSRKSGTCLASKYRKITSLLPLC